MSESEKIYSPMFYQAETKYYKIKCHYKLSNMNMQVKYCLMESFISENITVYVTLYYTIYVIWLDIK